MSEATIKRKVGGFYKARDWRKGRSTTKQSDLKEIIPIFTGPWEDLDPGHGQIDAVVRCGHASLGAWPIWYKFFSFAEKQSGNEA